jgi:hypothetical protein
MPGIRRLQPGYHPIGVLHSKEEKEKIRFCQRCEDMFGVWARLGPKILGVGESRPADYEHWIQCHNCGQVYAKHETKVEPELSPIKQPSDGKQGKIQAVGIEKKRKSKGRGYNPRLNNNKWEIKDEELNAELKSGAVLLAYSSNDPTEPTV